MEDVGGRALTDSIMRQDVQSSLDDTAAGKKGGSAVRPRKKGEAGELKIRLSVEEVEALQRIADRHKTTVEQVTRELLKSHLRWLDS